MVLQLLEPLTKTRTRRYRIYTKMPQIEQEKKLLCLDTTRPLSETNRPICLLDGIEYFSTQLRWAELSVGRIVCPPADMVMCLHGLYFASSFQWYFRMLSEYLFNVESTVLPESNWYNHFEIQCLHYCLSVRQQHSQLSNKYNVLQEA